MAENRLIWTQNGQNQNEQFLGGMVSHTKSVENDPIHLNIKYQPKQLKRSQENGKKCQKHLMCTQNGQKQGDLIFFRPLCLNRRRREGILKDQSVGPKIDGEVEAYFNRRSD